MGDPRPPALREPDGYRLVALQHRGAGMPSSPRPRRPQANSRVSGGDGAASLIFDHLVVVAPNLAAGLAHVRECIGIDLPEGGRHREMGTRNHLLRLSDATFLEVIATDPESALIPRARWFGLSDPARVRADWDAGRRLRGFVARTDQLDRVLASHRDLLGEAIPVTRGDLSWRFGLRPDGAWPADGAAPCVIDWGPRGNPAQAMPDLGAQLEDLVLAHPSPEGVREIHAALGLEVDLRIDSGASQRFVARIRTPHGVRTLT